MFNWSNGFSVNIPQIDQQHQTLFRIGKKVYLLNQSKDSDHFDELVSTLQELSDYAKFHFKEEEALLEQYEFGDLHNHKKEHQKFIDYLENITVEDLDQNQLTAIDDLIKFIASWILNHISKSDMKYVKYLNKKMEA